MSCTRVVPSLPVLPVSDENLQPLERSFAVLLASVLVVARHRPKLQVGGKGAEGIRLHLVPDVEDLARAQLQAR